VSTATTDPPTSTVCRRRSSTRPSSTSGSTRASPSSAARVRRRWRRSQKALEAEYPTHEAAREGIAKAIADFYATNHPDVARDRAEAVTAAGRAVGDVYVWNVFPAMNVTWGTYVNHIGHPDMSTEVGCFRCHGGEHMTEDGDTIAMDCTTCHSLLAEREEDPEVLQTLLD
jgi:hypothetical protein